MQTTPATTAINTQLLQSLIALGPLIDRMCSNDSGTDRWESTKQVADQARAAVQAATHQEVLEELIYAHKIILAAWSVMDAEAKTQFSQIAISQEIGGIAASRAHERLAAIHRAGGSL